jgi:hypothetical protein
MTPVPSHPMSRRVMLRAAGAAGPGGIGTWCRRGRTRGQGFRGLGLVAVRACAAIAVFSTPAVAAFPCGDTVGTTYPQGSGTAAGRHRR